MLVAFSSSPNELDRTKALLEWIAELDVALPNHRYLIVASSRVPEADVKQLSELAQKVFIGGTAIKQRGEYEAGWPMSANAMFRLAADWVSNNRAGHFFWLESDCWPLKSGWLEALDSEYRHRQKPFMGTIYDQPFKHLNGTMVYPQDINNKHPYMLHATSLPWDLVRPDLTMKMGHNTPLIQRMLADPKKNLAMEFADSHSLSHIRPDAVIFHGCKSLSLITQLRGRPIVVPPVKAKGFNFLIRSKITTRNPISIRRSGAIGDALAAMCVADKLTAKGFDVTFQAHAICQQVLKYCPRVATADVNGHCDVNLDEAYEHNPNRTRLHFAQMFSEFATRQLADRQIRIEPLNIAPTLKVKPRQTRRFNRRFKKLARPWVAICPRSNSFVTRTVPDETWESVARLTAGTKFWLGNHGPSPSGITDLAVRDIEETVIALSAMDMLVTVDSGPAHIAIAQAIPTVVIGQSSDPVLHFSDQRDWMAIYPDNLTCLNCQERVCRVHAPHPPCQDISAHSVATMVNRRLRASTDDVSAVVPIYRPAADRLNKCLLSVIPQVGEVVVCLEGGGMIPTGALQHPKVRYVKSRESEIGYGRNFNFGARHTFCPWLLELNDDVFLDPTAVAKLMEVAKDDDKIAVVGHLLWYPGRATIQHGGTRRNPGDFCWGHIDHRQPRPTITKSVECENVTHASVLMRRRAFYDVLGYDERYRFYFEDNEVNLRLRKAGWKIFYTSMAQGIHDEHSSTALNPQMSRHVAESQKLFREEWNGYFEHNRNNQLGNFNYK